ncbi:hypothetical protein [Ethanoligenens sp.]|uniref:hypothetical protein n=1 Tax=Ethanoligenens sp. TaxID=2099655 RepID=UPI0039E7ECAE
MYGAILEKGEKYYTYLRKVFDAIGNKQNEYNWLITDCVCYPQTQRIDEKLSHEYCWLSGNELTSIVESEDFQWIWAVLSGFSKDIPLAKVLESPLPFANGYTGFWKNPVSIQHPLASLEIVPWDGSLTLLISNQKDVVDNFMKAFPLSEDLSLYNAT